MTVPEIPTARPPLHGRRPRSARVRAAAVVIVVVTAVALGAGPVAAPVASAATTRQAAAPRTAASKAAPASAGTTTWRLPQSRQPYAAYLATAIRDLEAYWRGEYRRLFGGPLPGRLSFHAATRSSPPPACGPPKTATYAAVADNAYYCVRNDFVAYDDEALFPQLDQRLGSLALGIALAHETAHAVQVRANISGPSVLVELQADCLAGSWVGRLVAGRSPTLRLAPGDLDKTVVALLSFRDRPGTDPLAGGAHGTGFDRINAFQLGVEQGATRCIAFAQDPPKLTASRFRSLDEARSGGNLDYPTTVATAAQGLNGWWRLHLPGFPAVADLQVGTTASVASGTPECSGPVLTSIVRLCDDGTSTTTSATSTTTSATSTTTSATSGTGPVLLVDDGELRAAHDEIGDFAAAALLAQAWARLAVARLGPAAVREPDPALAADCLTGAWIAGVDEVGLSLSPGDVDEAISALVLAPDTASAFELVRALRAGFSSGPGACATGLR